MSQRLKVHAVRGDLAGSQAAYADALLDLVLDDERLELVERLAGASVLLCLDGRPRPRPGLRVVTVVHDLGHLLARGAYGRWEWLRQNWRVASAVRRSDHLVAPSGAVEFGLERYLGVPARRISAVPVLPAVRRASRQEVAELRERRGLPERYLLLAGYRHSLSLPPTELPLVPVGPADRADLAPLLSGAIAWLNPSVYEGSGLGALEAMACGTPPLVASTGALPHAVGAAGLILSPSDPAEWAAAVDGVVADRELRASLVVNGLKAVAELRAAGPPRAALYQALTGGR